MFRYIYIYAPSSDLIHIHICPPLTQTGQHTNNELEHELELLTSTSASGIFSSAAMDGILMRVYLTRQSMCVCARERMYACVCVCACVCVREFTCDDGCVSVKTFHVCVCARAHVCVCVCERERVCVRVFMS